VHLAVNYGNVDMQQQVADAIEAVKGRIEQFGQPGSAVNEANTKNWFIEPLLRAMGWDTHDPRSVQAEYRAQGAGQNPVDYALMVDGAPALFLEAKALGTPLQTPQFVNQVVAYGAVAGVQWVVITDGDEYRIYRTDTTAAAPDKLLASFRLSDRAHGTEALDFLMTLHRDVLALDKLHGLWTERDVDRKVKAELQTILSGEDDGFLKFLSRRIPSLRASDIAVSLRRATVTVAYPKASVAQSAPLLAAAPAATTAPRKFSADGGATRTERLARLVAALDEQGRSWPVTVEATYRGRDFTGLLSREGTLHVLNQSFGTFSAAGIAVVQSVSGSRATLNGWTFWRVRGRDGVARFVGDVAPR
jgi:hypothetical protein